MFDEKIKFKYSWRPYQAKVLEEVEKYIDDGKINIVAAPGSGKTVLGLELARRLSNPVLILSPTVTIKNQWIDRFITLFMPEDSEKPEWISDNVYELSYFNSITYQGLHYAYKRKNQKIQINLEETDDEIQEEKIETNIDVKTYDLISEINKNKIKTIVLDEAHHLKSEWWQSLTKVIEEIKDVTIISLTATPPYDIEFSEWKKYSELCGNIDMEISVPELVQAKNLCPHQDYIYFSYPTKKEKEMIKEYENKISDLANYLKTNKEFIKLITEHPYLINTNTYIENILEKPEFYSSMIIFLNYCNIEVNKEKIKILGHNKPIPRFTVNWLEILLQNIIFDDNEYFDSYVEVVDEIKTRLNKIGAIEKKKVLLSTNNTLQKYFNNSISKLESINKIVEAEYINLKKDLRMVILTDFLRKEYLYENNIEINKIGVFPIFLNLLKQNSDLNMAILTGSIFMIPNSKKENLIEIATSLGLNSVDINFEILENIGTYCVVRTKDKYKNLLMKAISTLFSTGEVNVIIGTKALLGEGWDEPSINSLILASFVGSYVLSNQMRGRAIRTNDNPRKTANVWHLVCVAEDAKNSIENVDFETLKRRFNAFVGIGYNCNVLENGIDRLDIVPKKFSEKNIDLYNKKVIEISNNREEMYNRWFELIDKFGGNRIKINNQLETKKENMKEKISIIDASKLLKFILTYIVLLAMSVMGESYTPTIMSDFNDLLVWLIINLIISAIINFKFVVQCVRAIKFSIPKEQLKTVMKVITKTLCEERLIKTKYEQIKIYSVDRKEDATIELYLDGVTTHENNLILKCMEEIFKTAENQRYILINKKKNILSYYNVPGILSTNKELAESFCNNWKTHIGECRLIYTKSVEGRKILIEARKHTFDYIEIDKFLEKKKPISNWK